MHKETVNNLRSLLSVYIINKKNLKARCVDEKRKRKMSAMA